MRYVYEKKFFTICAIVFLGFTGCTHRESANIDLTTSSVGVIETSGNSKKSRIYFYNQNLEKTGACGHFFRPLCLYSFYNLED